MTNYDDIINDHEERIETLEEGGGGTVSASSVSYDDSSTSYGETTVQKVLEKIKSLFANYLPLSGGTLTGALRIGNTTSQNLTLPFYDKNRTTSGSAVWLGFANSGGKFYIWDNANAKSILTSDADGTNLFNGHANSDLSLSGGTLTGDINAPNLGTRVDSTDMTANKTLTTAGTGYALVSVKIPAGNWVLVGRARYNAPSTTGYIRLNISNTSGSTTMTNGIQRYLPKQAGVEEVTAIVKTSSETTYYLNALSNVAGVVITSATTDLRAIRIS